MKVYFSTTPRSEKKLISNILQAIRENGHLLTSNFIENISQEEFYSQTPSQKQKYFDETTNSIAIADISIFEASTPSIGVGHLINFSVSVEKPTIVLYLKEKKPFMLEFSTFPNLFLKEYKSDSYDSVKEVISQISTEFADTRIFNICLTLQRKTINRMSEISKKYNIDRSALIEKLVNEHVRV